MSFLLITTKIISSLLINKELLANIISLFLKTRETMKSRFRVSFITLSFLLKSVGLLTFIATREITDTSAECLQL